MLSGGGAPGACLGVRGQSPFHARSQVCAVARPSLEGVGKHARVESITLHGHVNTLEAGAVVFGPVVHGQIVQPVQRSRQACDGNERKWVQFSGRSNDLTSTCGSQQHVGRCGCKERRAEKRPNHIDTRLARGTRGRLLALVNVLASWSWVPEPRQGSAALRGARRGRQLGTVTRSCRVISCIQNRAERKKDSSTCRSRGTKPTQNREKSRKSSAEG